MRYVLAGILFLSGCVTVRECNRRVAQARLEEVKNCQHINARLSERLRRFNQLNEDGQLK